MNAKNIRDLIRYLPADGPYPGAIHSARGSAAERAFREACLAICLNDPQFGFNFAMSFLSSGRTIPAGVLDMNIRRAFHYFARNAEDDLMNEVYALVHPANIAKRRLLNALLICRDTNLKQVAEDTSLPENVVDLYAQLWFNAPDRLGDKSYIASLVYPQTRLESMNSDPGKDHDYALELLRAGHVHGRDEVLFLAGMTATRKNSATAAMKPAEELENALLAQALTSVRHGGANAKEAPVIDRAKSLVVASKRVDPPSRTGDDVMGLGGISASRSVLSYLAKIQQPEINRRIAEHKLLHDAALAPRKPSAVCV